MEVTRLENESPAYRSAREKLLQAEVELMQQRERVAELRRELPESTPVEDYVFEDGSGNRVKLSESFTSPDRTLILYHFMYGKAQTEACPMCTMWADGWDGAAPHIAQRVDFAVVAGADIEGFTKFASSRGWHNLKLLAAADGSTFKSDLGSEGEDGSQWPKISVFRLQDGKPVHFYTAGAQMSEELWRGVDLLTPVWNMLDLTPEGRGDWFPSLSY